jgi:hypothetical protein
MRQCPGSAISREPPVSYGQAGEQDQGYCKELDLLNKVAPP